ncbi:hypothetical protein C8R44DRAFT_870498 [Mycena epipterygia]|nr:hypothetical protein C8R44DRAFT_870498 [Mycena epipterygia]
MSRCFRSRRIGLSISTTRRLVDEGRISRDGEERRSGQREQRGRASSRTSLLLPVLIPSPRASIQFHSAFRITCNCFCRPSFPSLPYASVPVAPSDPRVVRPKSSHPAPIRALIVFPLRQYPPPSTQSILFPFTVVSLFPPLLSTSSLVSIQIYVPRPSIMRTRMLPASPIHLLPWHSYLPFIFHVLFSSHPSESSFIRKHPSSAPPPSPPGAFDAATSSACSTCHHELRVLDSVNSSASTLLDIICVDDVPYPTPRSVFHIRCCVPYPAIDAALGPPGGGAGIGTEGGDACWARRDALPLVRLSWGCGLHSLRWRCARMGQMQAVEWWAAAETRDVLYASSPLSCVLRSRLWSMSCIVPVPCSPCIHCMHPLPSLVLNPARGAISAVGAKALRAYPPRRSSLTSRVFLLPAFILYSVAPICIRPPASFAPLAFYTRWAVGCTVSCCRSSTMCRVSPAWALAPVFLSALRDTHWTARGVNLICPFGPRRRNPASQQFPSSFQGAYLARRRLCPAASLFCCARILNPQPRLLRGTLIPAPGRLLVLFLGSRSSVLALISSCATRRTGRY